MKAPPQDVSYKMISMMETESQAILFYEFQKPGLTVPMAQYFETEEEKIRKILLVFDTALLH